MRHDYITLAGLHVREGEHLLCLTNQNESLLLKYIRQSDKINYLGMLRESVELRLVRESEGADLFVHFSERLGRTGKNSNAKRLHQPTQ